MYTELFVFKYTIKATLVDSFWTKEVFVNLILMCFQRLTFVRMCELDAKFFKDFRS